ncbi:3234_t:CDS:1, partial [Paraglomus occultum]
PETPIKANQSFTVIVKVTNLETGNFLDPNTDYYKFSQQLNNDGAIKGHLQITIQKLENLDTPPDPSIFAFFEGLNDKADKSGVLKQEVDKLSPGLYRICTISASASHAPVVMPVAKRGAQDDCVRFTVK